MILMRNIRFVVLAAALAAAAPLSAAPRRCANGLEPRLSGDAFSPVECSTKTLAAAALTGAPTQADKSAKSDLKNLAGRWEGTLSHALGRYELLLTVATHWGGKAELTLAMKERQFRERLIDHLALIPDDGPGAYEAELTTDLAPGLVLKGRAAFGAGAPPVGAASGERRADLTFVNGAAHRLYFQFKGKDELRLRAVSAVPGAPLQNLETVLRRTKRASL